MDSTAAPADPAGDGDPLEALDPAALAEVATTEAPGTEAAIIARSIATGGRTLRQHAARGTVLNTAFLVGLTTLGLLKGFIVAAFLTRQDYGIWGILVVGLGTLEWLKGSAISDKYVQQDEDDQELAFQRAFTFELIIACVFMSLAMLVVPLLAVIYHEPKLIAPGLLATFLLIPATALESPLWVFYRRMDFVRQRTLEAVDPLTAIAVTIALAIGGFGYWSLVIGTIAGAIAGAAVALRTVPYRIALRYDRDALRRYVSFSWPLFIAGGAGLVVAQSSLLVANTVLGLAAVGTIALTSSITSYADQLDAIITMTLYPAICAVRDRTDLLFETFVKSNRLALMWGMPFGVGLALFAPDLVRYGLGLRWVPAIHLIQVFGLIAASHQVAFNWTAYLRARGDTRPIATVNVVVMAVFLAAMVPLTIADGLDGFAVAMAITAAVALAGRTYVLVRVFPGFAMIRHSARAVAPSIPAAAAVLAVRLLETGMRTRQLAFAELALYVLVTLAATYAFERPLLREVVGYLRSRPA
jgi:O-antigen/teichoic acid export membrane protein